MVIYDNNDHQQHNVYYNPTAPTVSGASYLTSTSTANICSTAYLQFNVYKPT